MSSTKSSTFLKVLEMVWQPLNLSQACPAHSSLTSCSPFGYVFLHLVTSLYSGSEDLRIQEHLKDANGIGWNGSEWNVHGGQYNDEERTGNEGDNEEIYDFIVVGAGSAGCEVANRLTEVKKWKVLLLEAGPEEPDITMVPGLSDTLKASNVDWNYVTLPSDKACLAYPNTQCPWARGKMMGGTSAINTMVLIRGNRADYDGWAAMGNTGWSYEEVLPYFIKFENNKNIGAPDIDTEYHGINGPQSISRFPYMDRPSILITEAFHEIGLPITDLNGANQIGTHHTQAFSEAGKRASTNVAYIRPIRYKRKNIIVRPNSEVTKILIDSQNRAYGVKYVQNGKEYVAKVRKEVIVSGGTINSPKLLLQSGIGPRKHLEDLHIPVYQDLPVGENLQDHISFGGLVIAFDNNTATMVDEKQILNDIKEYKNMVNKQGPLASIGITGSLSFYKTDESFEAPDVQFQILNVLWQEYMHDPTNYMKSLMLPTVYYDAVLPRVQNIVPKSRGRISLNASNPDGPPIIFSGYLEDLTDLEPIKKGLKFMLQLENTDHFRSGRARFIKHPLEACKHTIWASDEYVECMTRHYTYALCHQVGTVKMGPEYDKTAVVDPRLRVHGISGLRVIDASIMPVIVRGNTNGPAIMIGEKGADMIKEDWLQ